MSRNARAARQYRAEIAKFFKQDAPKAVKAAKDEMAELGLREIVERTPVLSGRARGSWDIGVNEAPSGWRDRVDPGGDATVQAGTQAIRAAQPYDVIYVSSGAPYILDLEDGTSQQAPNGMVGITHAELASRFDRID